MRYLQLLILLLVCSVALTAQERASWSNPIIKDVIHGDFSPDDYRDDGAISSIKDIFEDIANQLSPDSLEKFLSGLVAFENRNSGADTLSVTRGIGAARNYILAELERLSRARKNHLVTGFYNFEREICGITRHKNVVAVLPGIGPNHNEFILVEAHYDSRCEDRCGIDCMADGADDNGSGTALVVELARVLSKYRFNRSIIFMLTTGEEQGLVGARSFATYAVENGINLRAVYNNDVVGGIICGETASPPGCPGLNAIDSVNLRVYSSGSGGSRNKGLARFAKLQYEEEMAGHLQVPSQIRLMSAEDRTGRGGDHIPFREMGFAAIRFTEANEHGHGNPSVPDYHDRQHSTRDVIGVDTTGDGVFDEYYVDFNYLRRNTLVNATAIVSTAEGPATPESVRFTEVPGGFALEIEDPEDSPAYVVGVRRLTSGPEFDTLITIQNKVDTIMGFSKFLYYVSVAAQDDHEVESLFTVEERLSVPSNSNNYGKNQLKTTWELLQNTPNPFDEATWIGIIQHTPTPYKNAFLVVTDMNGGVLAKIPVDINKALTEVLYDYKYHGFQPGVYAYSLVVDGQLIDTKRMIYAY
jgi:hypothetical protein